MSPLSNRIASLTLSTFAALPAKSKPRSHEWTPLSAIILSSSPATPTEPEILTIISLATGTKCLPAASLPRCNGAVLHDCHAEVLALRGWNYWLLAEIERVLRGGYVSRWLDYRAHAPPDDPGAEPLEKPFILRPDVHVYLFSTEAPCGDASMGLLIESTAQAHGDAMAWPEPDLGPAPESISKPLPLTITPLLPSTLHGRGYFSLLGLVRRKPSRADAQPTLSKSCTDKLSLKQVTSVLAWPVSLFVQRTDNSYLKSMILPKEKYDEIGFMRAFGRLGVRENHEMEETGGEAVKRFTVLTFPCESNGASLTFHFSKPSSFPTSTKSLPSKASNLSALWVAGPHGGDPLLNETLVNGVKQGAKQWGGQEFGMSQVCRRKMWEAGWRIVSLLLSKMGQDVALGVGEEQKDQEISAEKNAYLERLDAEGLCSGGSVSYHNIKQSMLDAGRRAAKENAMAVLGGWARNNGDAAWGLG